MSKPLNTKQTETARNNETAIFRGISDAGNEVIADFLGITKGQVSKMKTKGNPDVLVDWPSIAHTLAAMNIQAVPIDHVCISERKLNAIFELAKIALNDMDSASDLLDYMGE